MPGAFGRIGDAVSAGSKKTVSAGSSALKALAPAKLDLPLELPGDSFNFERGQTLRASYDKVREGAQEARLLGSTEPLKTATYTSALRHLKSPGFLTKETKKPASKIYKSAEALHEHATVVAEKLQLVASTANHGRAYGRIRQKEFAALEHLKDRVSSREVAGEVPAALAASVDTFRHALDTDLYLAKEVASIKHELKIKIGRYNEVPSASLKSLLKRQDALREHNYADLGKRRMEISNALMQKVGYVEAELSSALARLRVGVQPAALAPMRRVLDRIIAKLDDGVEYADAQHMEPFIPAVYLAKVHELHNEFRAQVPTGIVTQQAPVGPLEDGIQLP